MTDKPKVPIGVEKLKDDLVWAVYDVDQYKELFNSGDKTTRLLMKTAGHFFDRLHQVYWDRFTLAISRFTDPYDQGPHQNLSIHHLLELVNFLPEKRAEALRKSIESIGVRAEKFRLHRRKNIAHRDFQRAVVPPPDPDILRLTEVESILSEIGDCINEFYLAVEDSTWAWHMSSFDDASSLRFYLREGAIYSELKSKRKDWNLDAKEEMENTLFEIQDLKDINEHSGAP